MAQLLGVQVPAQQKPGLALADVVTWQGRRDVSVEKVDGGRSGNRRRKLDL